MKLTTTIVTALILTAPSMAYSGGYSEPIQPQVRPICEKVNREGCCMKPIPGTNAWQRADANCGMPFTPDDPERVPYSPPENDNGDDYNDDKPKDPPKDKPKDPPKDKPGCKCGKEK